MGHSEATALLRRHRLTVAQYHRMAEAGVLAPDARVELLEGEVVEMAPIGTRHAAAVKRLNQLLSAAAGTAAVVAVQDPLHLDAQSEPQPDLMLLRPRADFYASAHPGPADVLLLVEVADTTSRYDREVKVPLYAEHGVPEVWVIDLEQNLVHLLRQPAQGRYTEVQVTARPGLVQPQALPALRIDLGPLLGPQPGPAR
jgi:Uma2 family endonuclease